MFFTKNFFDKRIVFLIFLMLISFLSLNLNGMWGNWGAAVDPNLPQGALESDKRDAQIRFYRIKSPGEYSVNVYRWNKSVGGWLQPITRPIGWENPICGYCAAFYALQMGKIFERKHNATYQEFVDSFYEIDDTDPLIYVNYKPTKADTVDKEFLSEKKFRDIVDNVKELHDLSSLTPPSRPDQKLPNPIKSKFHHFCQQAYNLIDTSNPNQAGWITSDEIDSIVKILYPESIKDRTVVLNMSQDLPETTQRAIDLIRQVDENQSEYAILIYFNGSNHWGAGLVRKALEDGKLELIFTESMNFPLFTGSNDTIKQVLVKQALDPALKTPPDTLEKWLEKARNSDFVLREFSQNSLKLNYLMESEIWKNKSREVQGGFAELRHEIDDLNRQIRDLESNLERQRTGNASSEDQLRRSVSELENIKRSLQQKIADFLSSDSEYQTFKFLETDFDTPFYDRQQAKLQREAMEGAAEQNPDFRRQNSSLIQEKERRDGDIYRLRSAIRQNQQRIDDLHGRLQRVQDGVAQKERELRGRSDLVRTWLIPALAQENIKENNRGLFSALDDWWNFMHPKCRICGLLFNDDERIPIFLPCEPDHILCFPCFLNETKDLTQIAREYDGIKRTGKVFTAAICKPVNAQFISLARSQDNKEKRINFSFSTARFYGLDKILSNIPLYQKFSAQNAENRLKGIIKNTDVLNDTLVNQWAEDIANFQEEQIYPIKFQMCYFSDFINYGRPADASDPFKQNEEFMNNSDDLIFKTIWYGCDLKTLLGQVDGDKIKNPMVKAKLNFLLEKFNSVVSSGDDQRGFIEEFIGLLLWHGIPIAKITPLLRLEWGLVRIKETLKEVDTKLRTDEVEILEQLRKIGSKTRYYRDKQTDQQAIKIFDRQEWDLLNARRQVILQIIKDYESDEISLEVLGKKEISIEDILKFQEHELTDKVKALNLSVSERENLTRSAPVKRDALKGEVLRFCKTLKPDLNTYKDAVEWNDELDDFDIQNKLFQAGILTKFSDVQKLDKLINLLRSDLGPAPAPKPVTKIEIPRIFNFSNITPKLVAKLAAVDDLVRESEIKDLTQEQIEGLILGAHAIVFKAGEENHLLENELETVFSPKSEYYLVGSDDKIPEERLVGLEKWAYNRVNLARLEILENVLTQRVRDRGKLEQKIRDLGIKLKSKKSDILQSKLKDLKQVLLDFNLKLRNLGNKLGLLKRRVIR